MNNLGVWVHVALDHLREFLDRELIRVSDVDWVGVVTLHQGNQAAHQVVNKLEGPGLASVTIDGDVVSAQGLKDEVADL